MKIELNKKKIVIIFSIIISLISGFLQFININQNNHIFFETNELNFKDIENLKIAAIVQPDWQIARGDRDSIAIINKPIGTQEGDLLILHCTTDGDDEVLTGPSGWTVLLDQNLSGGQTTGSWYKIAGDSEPVNYNVSWSKDDAYMAGIIRIRGHDRNNPVQTTATATGTDDIINPIVNTTEDYTLIIGFHGIDGDEQGDNYGDYLEPGPAVLYARSSGGSQACSAGIYYEIQLNQGPSQFRIWDINVSTSWYVATVAINLKLPMINIVNPIENQLFGDVAPNFTVEIEDPNLDSMWYTLDGGLNNFTFTENDTINQLAWTALPDGPVTIRFYANNTLGNINFADVNVLRDDSAPTISIINPVENEIFGVDPPSFTVEIVDPNLDTMWYSIFNNTDCSLNITFIDNGIIDATEWDALYDGTYTLRFYANDTLGNINFEDVNIIKDMYAIIINITYPTENQIIGVAAPSFVVEFTDTDINTTWYTVGGGQTNYTFTENETINQLACSARPDGPVTIRFYANNTSGKVYFRQVNVIKDSSAPIINILTPEPYEEFGFNPPTFVVEITDPHLDTMWYSIDGGINSVIFTSNLTISQTSWETLWDSLAKGDNITIWVYANDTFGHLGSNYVVLIKHVPEDIIGLDFSITTILILITSGIIIIGIIIKIHSKKRLIS